MSNRIFDIRDAVTVAGIPGVTVGTFAIKRVSDTEVTIELEFDGNIDTDATLTFTVGADAIAGYNGPALTAQIPVTANAEGTDDTEDTPSETGDSGDQQPEQNSPNPNSPNSPNNPNSQRMRSP